MFLMDHFACELTLFEADHVTKNIFVQAFQIFNGIFLSKHLSLIYFYVNRVEIVVYFRNYLDSVDPKREELFDP